MYKSLYIFKDIGKHLIFVNMCFLPLLDQFKYLQKKKNGFYMQTAYFSSEDN